MKGRVRIIKSRKSAMPRRPSLFWDVDPKTVDPEKHARYIIERILDFGRDPELRWLVHYYSPKLIKNILRRSRGVINKKTRALWELVYR